MAPPGQTKPLDSFSAGFLFGFDSSTAPPFFFFLLGSSGSASQSSLGEIDDVISACSLVYLPESRAHTQMPSWSEKWSPSAHLVAEDLPLLQV